MRRRLIVTLASSVQALVAELAVEALDVPHRLHQSLFTGMAVLVARFARANQPDKVNRVTTHSPPEPSPTAPPSRSTESHDCSPPTPSSTSHRSMNLRPDWTIIRSRFRFGLPHRTCQHLSAAKDPLLTLTLILLFTLPVLFVFSCWLSGVLPRYRLRLLKVAQQRIRMPKASTSAEC
jgi:hypothetical protein